MMNETQDENRGLRATNSNDEEARMDHDDDKLDSSNDQIIHRLCML